VYPTDIEELINADPDLLRQVNSFQISSYEDEAINRRLKICLETVKNLPSPLAPTEKLHQVIFEGLCRVNQDFREVTKMFEPSCVEVQIYEFETGPFKERDIRVKNRYVVQ
jgi:phenylacetate-CoA ligase